MRTHQDFEELLGLLEQNHVRYLIVGGYAVAFHGYPRFTKNLDIFFENTSENISRLQKALLTFGFEGSDIPHDIFSVPGNILTFGIEPVRVDLLNRIDGVEFTIAYANRVKSRYGKYDVAFIGREELLLNKRSTNRLRDKADAEELS